MPTEDLDVMAQELDSCALLPSLSLSLLIPFQSPAVRTAHSAGFSPSGLSDSSTAVNIEPLPATLHRQPADAAPPPKPLPLLVGGNPPASKEDYAGQSLH